MVAGYQLTLTLTLTIVAPRFAPATVPWACPHPRSWKRQWWVPALLLFQPRLQVTAVHGWFLGLPKFFRTPYGKGGTHNKLPISLGILMGIVWGNPIIRGGPWNSYWHGVHTQVALSFSHAPITVLYPKGGMQGGLPLDSHEYCKENNHK